ATAEALAILSAALQEQWQLEDAELELRHLPGSNAVELRSPRIFLEHSVATAALSADPTPGRASEILTYFVNQFRAGPRATPYSMVAATGGPIVPSDMREDEILVNQWLADDLQVGPGAEIALSYFLPDSGANLVEATNRFRVRAVLPMSGPS